MNYILALLRTDFLLIVASVGTFIFALSDAVIMNLGASVCVLILGIATAYFSYRAKLSSERSEKNSEETKQAVNGITHEMIEAAKISARAEGRLEGKMEAELLAAKLTAAVDTEKQRPKP